MATPGFILSTTVLGFSGLRPPSTLCSASQDDDTFVTGGGGSQPANTAPASHALFRARPPEAQTVNDTIFARLPGDIRGLMIQATDQILGIGLDDEMRGVHLTDWSLTAVNHYRAMGVPEGEIADKVAKVLDSFLTQGRGIGLSRDFPVAKMLEGPVSSISSRAAPLDFDQKYDMPHYRELYDELGINPAYNPDTSRYTISLHDAIQLALKVGDNKHASEIFIHMIRTGTWEGVYKTAEKYGMNGALLRIGFLSLASFQKNNYFYNYLFDTIEAFKRVSGPEKTTANEVMYDLALYVSSPEFLSQIPEGNHSIYVEHAFSLLRSTGEVIKKIPIDSVKYDYVTVVSDPNIQSAIQKLIDQFPEIADSNDARLALAAIGDTNLHEQFSEIMSKIEASSSDGSSTFIYTNTAEILARLGDVDAVEKIKETFESNFAGKIRDGSFSYTLKKMDESVDLAKRVWNARHRNDQTAHRYDIAELNDETPDYILSARYEEHNAHKYGNRPGTPEPPATDDKGILRAWNIEIAQQLIAKGDGLNAIRPLLIAAILGEDSGT